MTYYENIQNVVDYIEDNISNELNLDIISKIACISKFHFHRMFKAIVGESLMNYIRKRRLLNAAKDIVTSERTILEIADSYLFNSHEVFTRAFKRYFNMTPKVLKKNKKLDFFEKKVELLGIDLGNKKFGTIMNSKLIEKESFITTGLSCITTLKEFKQEKSLDKLWKEFFYNIKKISNIKNDKFVYGFCQSDLSDADFKYLASIEVDKENNQNLIFENKLIPASKYLVFYHKGHFLKILEAYKYIYGVAIPQSGYRIRDELDDFVLYEIDKISNGTEYLETKIHIPIL